MTIVCGGHLFDRTCVTDTGGTDTAWLSLEKAGQLRYWATPDKNGAGAVINGNQVSSVRLSEYRRGGPQSAGTAFQFALRADHGRKRLVRAFPSSGDAAGWVAALTASMAGASRQAGRPNISKQGLVWAQHSESAWEAMHMQLIEHDEGGGGDEVGRVLRYGPATADGSMNGSAAQAVPSQELRDVQFGFDKGGGVERKDMAAEVCRHSCLFRVSVGGATLRLRTQTTRECIDWVHALRRVSADRAAHPELLPEGTLRLLRHIFRVSVCNADGTVRALELAGQIQGNRAWCSSLLPVELSPSRCVDMNPVASWLFHGEEHVGRVATPAGVGKCGLVKGLTDAERVSVAEFIAVMNHCHRDRLEAVARRYSIMSQTEAVQSLQEQWDLPSTLSVAEVVWVVEERLGIPHDNDPAVATARSSDLADWLVLLYAQTGLHILIVDEDDDQNGDLGPLPDIHGCGSDGAKAGSLAGRSPLPHMATPPGRRGFGDLVTSDSGCFVAAADDATTTEKKAPAAELGVDSHSPRSPYAVRDDAAAAIRWRGPVLSEAEEIRLALTPATARQHGDTLQSPEGRKQERRKQFESLMFASRESASGGSAELGSTVVTTTRVPRPSAVAASFASPRGRLASARAADSGFEVASKPADIPSLPAVGLSAQDAVAEHLRKLGLA